jgi:hypothetical protein
MTTGERKDSPTRDFLSWIGALFQASLLRPLGTGHGPLLLEFPCGSAILKWSSYFSLTKNREQGMTIELHLDDETQRQSIEAGFASVEEYLHNLIQRDRNRIAILKGIQDAESGNTRPFEEFDQEFRAKHGIDQDK